MTFIPSQSKLKLTLLGAAAVLLFTPSVRAANPIADNYNVGNSTQNEVSNLLAVRVADGCTRFESIFIQAETKDFYIYICGGDNPHTYVGIAKNGNGGIRIPLQSYNRNRFVAINGVTRYTVTRSRLIVTQRGKVIVNQRILYWN